MRKYHFLSIKDLESLGACKSAKEAFLKEFPYFKIVSIRKLVRLMQNDEMRKKYPDLVDWQMWLMTRSVKFYESMVSKGAYYSIENRYGATLLHLACYYGKTKLVRHIINKIILFGASDNYKENILHYAIKGGNDETISMIINMFNISSFRFILTAVDENGNSPLHFAYLYDNKEAIKQLIASGVDVNVKNKDGLIPPKLLGKMFSEEKKANNQI
jgi:ankyrin repeat protein